MSEPQSGFGPMDSTRPAALTAESAASSVPAAVPASAGAMLRQMREAAGVDVGVLASAMKVSLPKLEALEHDRLDQLPDVTFARALASAICRAFGVDPAPVLARMPAATPGLRMSEASLNEPFHPANESGSAALASAFSRPLLAVIVVLLLGAALLWLWPTWPIRLSEPESALSPATANSAADVAAVASEPVPAEAPSAIVSEAVAPALAAAASAPVQAPMVAVSASAPVVPSDNVPLSLSATGESWVTVHDANGKPLINRTLKSGETVALDGALPLSVTIGRKDAVQATVRGQPFDTRSLGASTVARFQVK